MASSQFAIFNKLDKFSGHSSMDMPSWLHSFERCYIIASKSDDLAKGQLLMMCLTGQALAVAEQLEEEKKTAQKYSALKERLEAVFDTTADREAKQTEFEKRILNINETEDEYMLTLIKLHRSASTDASTDDMTRNVKGKLLNCISPQLRRNLFIFCQDPHSDTITTEKLLEAVRKTKPTTQFRPRLATQGRISDMH